MFALRPACVFFTAPAEVLHVAAFPLHELSARCGSALSTLATTRSTSVDNGSSLSADATMSDAHWAIPGLEAIVRSMDSASGKSGTVACSDRHHRYPTVSSSRDTKRSHPSGVAEIGPPVAPDVGVQVGVLETGAQQIAAFPHCKDNVVDKGLSDKGTRARGEVASEGGSQGGVGGQCVDSGKGAEAGGVPMMDLDALEQLLGGRGPTAVRFPAISAAASAMPREDAEAAKEVNGKGHSDVRGDLTEGLECVKMSTTGESTVNFAGKCGSGNDGAWEMVENWTPCAIGTLPGWSGAHLHC